MLQNNPRKPKVSIQIIKNTKEQSTKTKSLNTNNQKCKNKQVKTNKQTMIF